MRRKKRYRCEFFERIQSRFGEVKAVLTHLSLYVGLIVYTLLGAMIFQFLEHPVEKEKLTTLQDLVISERQNFLSLVYNLTAAMGGAPPHMIVPSILFSKDLIGHKYINREKADLILDNALLEYERAVSVAADEGVDIETKTIVYQWTYVQAVFFASTIITTIGYGNIAPVTTKGRVFCILFAIVGIPFTLSVIADVGQLLATLLSVVWARIKPSIQPAIDYFRKIRDKYFKRRTRKKKSFRRGSTLSKVLSDRLDTSSSGEEDENEEEEEDEEGVMTPDEGDLDSLGNLGITANIVMAVMALAVLTIFLSFGSYIFTLYEKWTFFEAFYYCFITITTIGFGDMVPDISGGKTSYMIVSMIYILVGLAFTSTIIELVRRQYAESWRKMQELRAQIQAQLKLAETLRRLGQEGKDIEGMDVDLDELRSQLMRFKRLGKLAGFDINDLEWMDADRRRIKAITILFYETSV
ncbi:TWiK family of potassium channels protein 7 [Lepeophtheirus salmonis]|nr:potassium channel subfamily K member 5-like [Lepeophtheirus salmonis]XP_040563810.1 potassium channel subfamily K member 5-like [Lepeophtheirus salmonis]